jgi:hypothetical protein
VDPFRPVAYGVFIGSVSLVDVDAYRRGSAEVMAASLLVKCSHLAAYWLREDPLGDVLGAAIDEGQRLSTRSHPLRAPMFVEPAEVCRRASRLAAAWQRTSIADDWGVREARKVTDVYAHACARGEAIVVALEAPSDPERAGHVVVPLTWTVP